MRYGKSMSEALAEIREGFSPKQIKMAIGIASDPRYKQGNYTGAFKQIEKIKKGLASHPQVAAVLKRQNEEILEKVKCPECNGEGCDHCDGKGYHTEALDKEDEPFVKDLIKKLRKGSATHGKQADDLEKAVKEETELDEMKEPFVVVDTADGDKVVGTASSEKGAKEIITTAQLPPMKIKDKKTLKIVKVKKKQMIGHPIKEETELDENRAARDARRAMAKDKDMQQRPFDKDDKATAIDIQKGKQNIVVQLKKATNLGGSKPITFDSGPDKKVDPKFARAALDKLNKIKRSDDKLKFQMKLSKSYKDMLQALKEDYEVELEEGTVVESWELDEMKMNDPKLLKIFDKLKKGSTVKIKIDSAVSKGKDYREFTVTAKNIVGKGKKYEQEKITLKAKDNPTGVKHFLYNRDGKVTLAIGDMGASIADIKEDNMSAYTAAITKGVK